MGLLQKFRHEEDLSLIIYSYYNLFNVHFACPQVLFGSGCKILSESTVIILSNYSYVMNAMIKATSSTKYMRRF